jgi:hypothetical protein
MKYKFVGKIESILSVYFGVLAVLFSFHRLMIEICMYFELAMYLNGFWIEIVAITASICHVANGATV